MTTKTQHLFSLKQRAAILFCILCSFITNAQPLTQTLRGTVYDKVLQTTLPGATIVVVETNPVLATASDANGNFRIGNVPVGRHTIKVTYVGYNEIYIPNVLINSGKETVINIQLEENILQAKEAVVEAKEEKNKPLNDMAAVSARTFSVEETQKYAAAVNDPGRMASSFAGVVSTDDGNNEISVRGNNPNALLWRLEGIDIPNPNHFSDVGSSGGGISILSAQLLSNSDFFSGAYPAEYGNALSSVFDLKLRKGNNEKREYTFQAGFLGLDFAAEGPFSKNYAGSYLINYRYSTLSILDKININIGDAVTNFQDLSYNFFLPTKHAGTFSLFGFTGLSDQKFSAEKDSSEWENQWESYSWDYIANTSVTGLKHSINLGSNTYITNTLSYAFIKSTDNTSRYEEEYVNKLIYKEDATQQKVMLTSVLNHKLNARNHLRAGLNINNTNFDFEKNEFNFDTDVLEQKINSNDNAAMLQLFAQWNFRMTEKVTLNGGVHFSDFMLNNTLSFEPRASVSYQLRAGQTLSAGYGLHSQTQPLGVYFAADTSNGTIVQNNLNLELSKSHHAVLSYDVMIDAHHHLKAETYYQSLYNIPVGMENGSTFSILNQSDGFVTEQLNNNGLGRNYGLELTFERFLYKQFYYLLAVSIFDSKYLANDNVWRNTKYNGHYSATFTGGKEFSVGKKEKNRTLGLNLKVIYRGGYYQTPVDLEQSMAEGHTVSDEANAYSEKMPAYFRTDIKVSLKRNKVKSTQTISLDLQNATNRKNIYGKYYDSETMKIETWYQTPLIPVLSYKIEF